jgi:hypothetical protein
MTFVQIISMHTDRFDEMAALESEWKAATEGRRTLLAEQAYVDRHDPRHFVVVNEFESYEQAMINSDLPETTALAAGLQELADGPADFQDLELIEAGDVRRTLAARLRHEMETSGRVAGDLVTDDIVIDAQFPHSLHHGAGAEVFVQMMTGEAPGRTVDRWECTTTERGFVVEYSYRTVGNETDTRSVGVIVATVGGGRISRMLVTCAGSWTPQTEAQILADAGLAAV